MYQIPLQTSRVPCRKEGRDVQHHYFMDSGQGFVCIVEGALLCLRGSRAITRPTTNIREIDFEIEKELAGLL